MKLTKVMETQDTADSCTKIFLEFKLVKKKNAEILLCLSEETLGDFFVWGVTSFGGEGWWECRMDAAEQYCLLLSIPPAHDAASAADTPNRAAISNSETTH